MNVSSIAWKNSVRMIDHRFRTRVLTYESTDLVGVYLFTSNTRKRGNQSNTFLFVCCA